MVSAAEQLAANLNFGAFAKADELKKRIWFTLGALLVYRLGTYIPLPGIDPNIWEQVFRSQAGGILGMTKTAQLSVARGLAQLTRGTGVTVNSVLPGPTMTATLLAGVMILLLVYFVWLAARWRKNWPRWVLAAALVLSVISLGQIIGEKGMSGAGDGDGVVNPDGTVKGISGLRVADASIMTLAAGMC